jgi:hypothetical protein
VSPRLLRRRIDIGRCEAPGCHSSVRTTPVRERLRRVRRAPWIGMTERGRQWLVLIGRVGTGLAGLSGKGVRAK